MSELTIWTVASMFSVQMPPLRKRAKCIFREHKRRDPSLTVFQTSSGDQLWKCFSCDPPDNVGDAVALYARLAGLSRKDAWNELREKGYAVPGARDSFDGSASAARRPKKQPTKPPPMPVRGRKPDAVISLSPERWQQLADQRLGAVERFAEQRKLPSQSLRQLDVVDMRSDAIGFGYRLPFTQEPCRIKVRPLDTKTFWIEPKPAKGQQGKALNPLYLAHRLQRSFGSAATAVIVEGETDALTVTTLDIDNAVSLPDGVGSARFVDLEPISAGFTLWLVATDADDDGDLGHRQLVERATRLGITTARLRWNKDGVIHKDANDALVAGFSRDDFIGCMRAAAQAALGFQVSVA